VIYVFLLCLMEVHIILLHKIVLVNILINNGRSEIWPPKFLGDKI
jgi:hypothetical protein